MNLFSQSEQKLVLIGSLLLIVSGCLNPFAPTFNESDDFPGNLLGDQRTLEGVFQIFRMSYTTQDTLLYGRLLDPNFVFMYTDYDRGFDVSWGRDEDMRATHRMFMNARSIDLIWNDIISQTGDSLRTTVRRSFNLTITFSAEDIVSVGGYANLQIERGITDEPWKITRWRDESNY
jgi:hypothetical protein